MQLTFTIERDEETGAFTASWNDPSGGGITTQAPNVQELEEAIKEAVKCHFAEATVPKQASLHFTNDLILQLA